MIYDDIFSVAEDILKSIDKATDSGNFTNLGKDVRRTVDDARDIFFQDRDKYVRPNPEKEYLNRDLGATISQVVDREVNDILDRIKSKFGKQQTPYFSTKINKSKGILRIVFGSLMLGLSAIEILTTLAIIKTFDMVGISFVVAAVEAAIGGALLASGSKARGLINNYLEYGRITGAREYVTVRELADRSRQNQEMVLKNLKKIMKKGYLPTAFLDAQESTLMLTDNVYQQYIASKKAMEEKHEREAGLDIKNYQRSYYTIEDTLPDDVKGILKDGNEYLNKIRYYNDLIPDTEIMSDKLYTLEATVLSIFKKLKEEPGAASDLRKLMSYYLPTTEKLLQSYVNLKKQPDSIDNIRKSQMEIEDALDVINDAFVKLLNQLFQNDAWDISSDISVLKTMMKQDSLI